MKTKSAFLSYVLFSISASGTLIFAAVEPFFHPNENGFGGALKLELFLFFLTVIFALILHRENRNLFSFFLFHGTEHWPKGVPKWPRRLILAAILLFFASCFLRLIPGSPSSF